MMNKAKSKTTSARGTGGARKSSALTHEVRRVNIERKLFADDPDMVEDLIAAACNDAANKLAEETQARMQGVAGGMNLPAGFKLPF